MTTLNKIKWAAGILLVFFIVVTTNLIDKNNFSRLRYSVTTIYEDRIVASDLLFELLMLIHEKEVAVFTADAVFFQQQNAQKNREIDDLIIRYEQTQLTKKEEMLFSQLKKELRELARLEQQYTPSEATRPTELLNSLDQIVLYLQDLSKVQLAEGKRQMLNSNKTMDTIDLFTQIEIIFLILMAILIQIIVLYKPRSSSDSED